MCIRDRDTAKDSSSKFHGCALPGFVDSKNEEKTERTAGYLVVSQSGGGLSLIHILVPSSLSVMMSVSYSNEQRGLFLIRSKFASSVEG